MGYYNVGQVCLNGHAITGDSNSGLTQKFCSECGSPTICKCQYCSEPIHGRYHEDGVIVCASYVPDAYCYSCGKPYPWTEKAINSVAACIYEDEAISQELAGKLVESLPDIASETPASNLATLRFNKALSVVGKFTAESIRQFVIDFGCELAKRSLLP